MLFIKNNNLNNLKMIYNIYNYIKLIFSKLNKLTYKNIYPSVIESHYQFEFNVECPSPNSSRRS